MGMATTQSLSIACVYLVPYLLDCLLFDDVRTALRSKMSLEGKAYQFASVIPAPSAF